MNRPAKSKRLFVKKPRPKSATTSCRHTGPKPCPEKKRLEKDDTHVTVYLSLIGSKNEPINAMRVPCTLGRQRNAKTSLEFPRDPLRGKGYSTTWEPWTLMMARQLTQQVRRNAVISTCTLTPGYTRAKIMGTGGKSIRVVYDIRKNCRFLSCQSAELTTTLLRHLLAHYYAVIMLRRGLP